MLNDEQEKAVMARDRFIFLLAGAGSGKTRVIIEKIKRLIHEGVFPNEILAITFTRKSSIEMKERLNHPDVHIHTFHQLAYIILKEQLHLSFEMVDDSITKEFTDYELLQITNYKNSMMTLKKPSKYLKYQQRLHDKKMFDFDDLLLELLNHIHKGHVNLTYTYIFIDEFQDTNKLQYALLKKMIKPKTHVFAVGDPDQSIYQFRGATPKIIDTYVLEYKAVIYTLSVNYRSDSSIIHAANSLIKRNHRSYKKNLKPHSINIGTTLSYRFNHDLDEALWVIETIVHYKHKGISFNNIAVLYRNHFRAYQLIMSLYEKDIPFHIHQGDDLLRDSAINLMTIHQAKGLEFDIVFIIGCEDRVLPSHRQNMKSAYEEERRLMFVAITRAKHILYLTSIILNQDNHYFTISPFISESGLKSTHVKLISDIISLGDNDGR